MNANNIKTYKAIILLNEIISNGRVFNIVFNDDDKILEEDFVELMAKGYVDIDNKQYVATEAGQTVYDNFMKRYFEYLKVYDIYCAVDTKVGDFAFEKIFDYKDELWDNYKNLERFFDLRIAVAEFKKIDPSELVFMSFINENRFDTKKPGWQFDLKANNIWAEIDNIVATAPTIEDLGGADTVQNIVTRGTEIMFELFQKEISDKKAAVEEAKQEMLQLADDDRDYTEEYITETTTIIEEYEEDVVYYDPYWDPYYCSPIWFVPLFLW